MRPSVLITALQGILTVVSAIPTPGKHSSDVQHEVMILIMGLGLGLVPGELASREVAHTLRHDVDSLVALKHRESEHIDVSDAFKKRESEHTDVSEGFKKREGEHIDVSDAF
ncbi:hypothetical protein F4679DRAFT_380534 [Xylaria curta]|nr:hypothetical protein F4679DRAFT_380534 [Xylaria curta]